MSPLLNFFNYNFDLQTDDGVENRVFENGSQKRSKGTKALGSENRHIQFIISNESIAPEEG